MDEEESMEKALIDKVRLIDVHMPLWHQVGVGVG